MHLADTEAEYRVLSGMLHSEPACADALLVLNEYDFTDEFNRKVLSLIGSLYAKSVKPTLAEIMKQGMETGLIAHAQDAQKITDISGNYIDDGNINYWAELIKTKAKVRKMESMLKKYTSMVQVMKDAEAEKVLLDASIVS